MTALVNGPVERVEPSPKWGKPGRKGLRGRALPCSPKQGHAVQRCGGPALVARQTLVPDAVAASSLGPARGGKGGIGWNLPPARATVARGCAPPRIEVTT